MWDLSILGIACRMGGEKTIPNANPKKIGSCDPMLSPPRGGGGAARGKDLSFLFVSAIAIID